MKRLPCALLTALLALQAAAQPQPGDVFREYAWANPQGNAGGSLRVGGKLDYGGGAIPFPHALDLEHATRAEVVVEKLLCHDGTRGLSIAFNGRAPIVLPEPSGIPTPQWEFQHFTYPVAAVPLEYLKSGDGNTFALRVDPGPPPNWPQNLIYGLQLRIYYDAAKKPHASGRIASPATGATIGREVELRADIARSPSPVARVEYLGLYDGVNWEGDGVYRQWHHIYHKGALTNHLGTAHAAPWKLRWDTSWIPDQREPVQLIARLTDVSGLTFVTDAVTDLKLVRSGLSVELCRPYDLPKKWVTRAGEKSEKFRVEGDLARAAAARLVWSSWSPGYMEGMFLNDVKVFEREGPRYACFWHDVPLTNLGALRPGENTLKTGMTPKYDGKMVHGMEVNWPGVMVLIQYRAADAETQRSKDK
jgi:hypothetical protein